MSLAGFFVVTRRLLVILSAIFTVYLAIGSWLYGLWFFGLLWRAKFWQFNYWLDGLFSLINNHGHWVITFLIATYALGALIISHQDYLFPRIDRSAWFLISGFACAIIVISIFVYNQNASTYASLETLDHIGALAKEDLESIESQGTLTVPAAPIDFKYLDEPRVEGLYSQLEPEMVESQRTLQDETVLAGKAGLGAGTAANAGVELSRQSRATSSLQRVEFPPQRKAALLVKYLIEKKAASYYSTYDSWSLRKSMRELQDELEQRKAEPITLENLQKLQPLPIERPLGNPPTKAERERAERQERENEQALSFELRSLTGLVFIGGKFSVTLGPADEFVLTRTFSEKPKVITFRIAVPKSFTLQNLHGVGGFQGTVLGSVTRPLNDNGTVEVSALAIY